MATMLNQRSRAYQPRHDIEFGKQAEPFAGEETRTKLNYISSCAIRASDATNQQAYLLHLGNLRDALRRL